MRRLVALLVVVLLAGCGTAQSGRGFVSGDGSYTTVPPAQRKAAPALKGTTVDGGTFDPSTLTGKVVVINVWGSWCAPCRKEAADLQAAATQTSGKAVFVGVNTRDLDPAPAQAFQRAFGVTYPSLYDPTGALLLGFTDLPPNAIPSTLVLDAKGRVAARIVGPTTTAPIVGLDSDIAEGH
ncbi:MAG: TlpA family protein disulfide reductase [Actinobacteria bacterium]|nr:TlpA family protein disulfide reductase [Actinomycetota bacterium]